MLHLFLGKKVYEDDYVFNVGSYFHVIAKQEWFDDPLVQQAIKDVDKNTYYYGKMRWESPWLGVIGAEQLSTGVKNLISAYYMPDHIFSCDYLGANCAEPLKYLAKNKNMFFTMGNYWFNFIDQDIFVENWKVIINGEDLYREIISRRCLDLVRDGVLY